MNCVETKKKKSNINVTDRHDTGTAETTTPRASFWFIRVVTSRQQEQQNNIHNVHIRTPPLYSILYILLVPTAYNLLQRRHDIVNRKRHVVGRRVFFFYSVFVFVSNILWAVTYYTRTHNAYTSVCIGMGYPIVYVSLLHCSLPFNIIRSVYNITRGRGRVSYIWRVWRRRRCTYIKRVL